jgi:hypothetical protein
MDPGNTSRGNVTRARQVYVLATSEAETMIALETAQRLALSEQTSIVVLVPHEVPYGTELERCGHDLRQLAEPYRTTALAGGVDTTVRVCACREARHMFGRMLIEHAHVVLAGRRGRWRQTRAERLARALECEGHHVVFVDLDGTQPEPAQEGSSAPGSRASLM